MTPPVEATIEKHHWLTHRERRSGGHHKSTLAISDSRLIYGTSKSAVVAISEITPTDEDVLAFVDQTGISGSWNAPQLAN